MLNRDSPLYGRRPSDFTKCKCPVCKKVLKVAKAGSAEVKCRKCDNLLKVSYDGKLVLSLWSAQ